MRAGIVLVTDAEPQMTKQANRRSSGCQPPERDHLAAVLPGVSPRRLGGRAPQSSTRQVGDEAVKRMITLTLEEQPARATHWSTREMACKVGMSQTMVSRVWCAFGLQLHRSETFKLSRDPAFVDKVWDVAGLYLNLNRAGNVGGCLV